MVSRGIFDWRKLKLVHTGADRQTASTKLSDNGNLFSNGRGDPLYTTFPCVSLCEFQQDQQVPCAEVDAPSRARLTLVRCCGREPVNIQ